jgi:hypothetical protein
MGAMVNKVVINEQHLYYIIYRILKISMKAKTQSKLCYAQKRFMSILCPWFCVPIAGTHQLF